MQDDPEKIAAGLSEAQRKALVRVCDAAANNNYHQIAAFNRHTYLALKRRGLVDHRIIAMVSCMVATPLGISVRAILERPTDEAS